MGTLDLAKYQLHYHLSGQPRKPLILFLHGFMGNCHDFDRVIPLLCDDFMCLVVDLPGHGQTKILTPDRSFTLDDISLALIQVLESLGRTECALVGYSMGGRLALYLTLYFPERFSKVMIESASPGLKTEMERMERIDRDLKLAKELETGDFLTFLLRWYENPLFASFRQHSDFPKMLRKRLQNDPLALANVLQNLGTGRQPSLWPMLAGNDVPMLLLSGEFDAKFSAINAEMKQLCHTAEFEIVPNVGHNIHFEDPHAFAKLLRRFLGTI